MGHRAAIATPVSSLKTILFSEILLTSPATAPHPCAPLEVDWFHPCTQYLFRSRVNNRKFQPHEESKNRTFGVLSHTSVGRYIHDSGCSSAFLPLLSLHSSETIWWSWLQAAIRLDDSTHGWAGCFLLFFFVYFTTLPTWHFPGFPFRFLNSTRIPHSTHWMAGARTQYSTHFARTYSHSFAHWYLLAAVVASCFNSFRFALCFMLFTLILLISRF